MKHSEGFLKLVQDILPDVKELDTVAVKTLLDQNADFHLIDVREESEWQINHLPKALHLSKGIIERDIEKCVPDRHAQIILYCGGGSRSALAAYNLQKMGYSNVLSMKGGYRGWCANQYPLELSC